MSRFLALGQQSAYNHSTSGLRGRAGLSNSFIGATLGLNEGQQGTIFQHAEEEHG